jgi:hypothetical protein
VKFLAFAAGRTVQRPATASEHSSISIPFIRKGFIVKRIFCLPVRTGSIALAAMLTLLAPITSSWVYAQGTVYYNPYGQGPYGEYSQGYAGSSQAKGNMFPSHDGMFGSTEYRYSGYGNVPTGYGHRVDNGISPYVRVYGRSSYYQPSYGAVYVPFGYRGY